jgi:hypothetical protein
LQGSLPAGLKTSTVYYWQRLNNSSNLVRLFESLDNLEAGTYFDFTVENLQGTINFFTVFFDKKYSTFACVERAATNVQDMFCCPPKAELNTTIPEFLTLDTGSEDDSGNYYLATYKVMNSVPNWVPPLGYQPANLAYKSRNKPYVPITRMQNNIYAGPNRYETVNQMYTIAWEMMTDHEVVNGLATGNIRLKVLCNVWALTPDNMPADVGGLKTLQEYYSEWVDKDEFDYAGTCTILNNMDVDFMHPSRVGYYATPAGLPIPHTVSVSRSAANVTMPSTLYLNIDRKSVV